jgi:hypothetical protein
MSEEDAKRVETQTIVSRSWAREGLMFAAHPRPGSMNLPVTADARSVSLEGGCALPANPNRIEAESFILSMSAKIFSIRYAIPIL